MRAALCIAALLALGLAREAAAASILLVTNDQGNTIEKYDAQTYASLGSFATGASGLSAPEGIAIGPDGNVYVANSVPQADPGNKVLRYSPGGALLSASSFISGYLPTYTYAMKFGPDGNLYLADNNGSGQIERFNGTTGAYLGRFTTGAGDPLGFAGALDFAWGPDGKLYVADYAGKKIERYNGSTGAYIDTIASGLVAGASGLTIDASGNLYLSRYADGYQIEKFSSTGTDLGAYTSGVALNYGFGSIFMPNGDLIVASHGHSPTQGLYRFNSSGVFVSEVESTYTASFEVILTVPEPGTLALLGLGAALARRLARRARID